MELTTSADGKANSRDEPNDRAMRMVYGAVIVLEAIVVFALWAVGRYFR